MPTERWIFVGKELRESRLWPRQAVHVFHAIPYQHIYTAQYSLHFPS